METLNRAYHPTPEECKFFFEEAGKIYARNADFIVMANKEGQYEATRPDLPGVVFTLVQRQEDKGWFWVRSEG